MIFILDILLIFNIWLAFKYSKYLFSPPILMGIGFVLASLIATLYYKEWELEDFSYYSMLCIGVGSIIFTLSCILFQEMFKGKIIACSRSYSLNKKWSIIIVCVGIILAAFVVIGKQNFYASKFGGSSFSELIFAVRMAGRDDEDLLELPRMLKNLTIINSILSFYVYIIFAYALKNSWGIISYLLCVFYLFLRIYEGTLTGAKGSMLLPIIYFGIMYLFLSYLKQETIKINLRKISSFAFVVFIFLGSFRTMASFLGRENQAEVNNADLVAEYLGAEIKNFDLELKGYANNVPSENFMGYTLSTLYDDLDIKNNISYNFLSIGNQSLGNVYTQFYCYYKDFGILGCIFMPIIVAFFSMFIYNLMLRSIIKGKPFSIGLFWYSAIAYSIIMSFFDAYVLRRAISLQFFKTDVIYLGITYIFFSRLLITTNKPKAKTNN